jgi:hypothetical protein
MAPERPGQPADELAVLVYNELRRLAGAYMRRERPGQTIQATALVHEAYLRLADAGTPWKDERHFVGIAARSCARFWWSGARTARRSDGRTRPCRSSTRWWGGRGAMLPALDEA